MVYILHIHATFFLFWNFREIAELHKANAAKASESQQAALSAEMQAKQELQLSLERAQYQARRDQEALINQANIYLTTQSTKIFILQSCILWMFCVCMQ